LPLGEGILLDPFMGSGATLAAAEALGLTSTDVERHRPYFEMAAAAVMPLSRIHIGGQHQLGGEVEQDPE
jgi:site-specific DNA-methyltransferase (adenine-specific)